MGGGEVSQKIILKNQRPLFGLCKKLGGPPLQTLQKIRRPLSLNIKFDFIIIYWIKWGVGRIRKDKIG